MKKLLDRFFPRRKIEDELREEIESHIQMRAELNMRAGMAEDEALREARKRFGNRTLIHETTRSIYTNTFMEALGQDIRYAFRGFLRMPGFTVAALLALALGIGSTTAVFSAVDRILFRSLPYPDDERLVSFGMVAPLDTNEFVLSADWFDWRVADTPFESMTTFTAGGSACDLADDTPIRLQCVPVEATFLKTFGIRPVIGRDFTPEDDHENAPKVGIISYGLWQNRYGGTTNIVGQAISLSGVSTTVLGVLPRDFEMPNLGRADIFVPQALPLVAHPNSGRPLRAFARLKPNVTIAQAQSAMQPIFRDSLRWVPEAFRNEVTLRVRSLRDRQVQDVRLASWVLFGSVFAVLLIACANVSNLLLARAVARRREFAVRSAIGASRGRLIRQALTESLALGSVGGALGCGLTMIILRVIISIGPSGIPRLEQASLDIRSLVFAVGVSLISGLIFGLAPALYSPSPETLVHRGNIGTRGLARQSLITLQIAVSLILLTSAGLLMRTLWNLQNLPLGMRTESVIAAPILLGQHRYGPPRQQRLFFEELESRLRSMSGLGDVALSDSVPLGGTVSDMAGQLGTEAMLYANLEIAGRPAFPKETGGLVAWRRVSPDYFRVLEIPIVRGRGFIEEDRSPSQQVVIISDSLAQRLFPNEEALGKQIRWAFRGPFRTIVGIAANVRNNPGLAGTDDPEYYVPRKQDDAEGVSPRAAIILRTSLGVEAATNAMRATVAAMDPTLPVNVYTMDQRVSELVAGPRFNAVLAGWFGAIGVLLAAIGLYGVISFLVTQRTQEIGIRLALGATCGSIIRLVFSAALRWTAIGMALGFVGSLFATRLLRTLLFKVAERDLWTLFLTMAVMLGIALLAAWLPSHRASRTDPMVALRQD
jgi:predicted permease